MRTQFREVFLELGFEEMPTDRFVESSFWNFDSLFQPQQVILPTAPGVSNEGRSSPLLALAPTVSWPWVPACGSLEPSRRDGENAQKTG